MANGDVWVLHEKIGKGRWHPVGWCGPKVSDDRDAISAEDSIKLAAKSLTGGKRKYKAVRYVPLKGEQHGKR